jgi:hypothetical protein
MLLQFSVSNYRAFRELQALDLTASNYDKALPENCIAPDLPGLKKRRWVKGAAIYGANASGKSTLIDAIHALVRWVGESAKTTDPETPIEQIDPFALDAEAAGEPTAFAIAFVSNGVRYEYRVAATKKLIRHESLRAFPKGKEQVWFVRDWSPDAGAHAFSPDNPKGLPRDRAVEKRTLPNMLYLSKAVAENRKELEPVYRWLVGGVAFINFHLPFPSVALYQDTLNLLAQAGVETRERIVRLLRNADLGIREARQINSDMPKEVDAMFNSVNEHMPEEVRGVLGAHLWRTEPELLHAAPGGRALPLSWGRESHGTHRLFALVGPLLEHLRAGRTLCVDELETSMHPLMVRELLKLFFSDGENTANSQLIFTTHNPLLLDPTLVRRDQVWFTDKDEEGRAHLYPLTDYEPRVGESLVRGYLTGRYGGVPFVPEGLLGSFSSAPTRAVSNKPEVDG